VLGVLCCAMLCYANATVSRNGRSVLKVSKVAWLSLAVFSSASLRFVRGTEIGVITVLYCIVGDDDEDEEEGEEIALMIGCLSVCVVFFGRVMGGERWWVKHIEQMGWCANFLADDAFDDSSRRCCDSVRRWRLCVCCEREWVSD